MWRKIVAGAVVGIMVISVIAAGLIARMSPVSRPGGGDVAVIDISGTIATGGSSTGLLGGTTAGAAAINQQLRKAGDNPDLKAVVLRLNSPGGTVAGSQEVAMEVDRLREAGKVVVASMGDMAASGAYWIAARCDKIVANPGTMTGSIGVIMQLDKLEGLYEKLGIEHRVLKKGEYKDMGSAYRDITEEEKQILQEMIDENYRHFVDAIAEGRNMDREKVKQLASGRVFTGSQALEVGLVDKTGNFYDAVDLAADLAGIKGEPDITRLQPERNWWQMLQGSGAAPLDNSSLRFLLEHYPLALLDLPSGLPAGETGDSL